MLELANEERVAWLNALCANQPETAADLQVLLAQLQTLDREGFLENEPVISLKHTSLTGQTLGAYTVEAPIGVGGMGSVWLARRSDGRFEGQVAIKLLSIALLGQGGEARFHREGRVLARLTHPNIARILDAGVTSTAQPYLVLEYVEGSPIDRYCEDHDLGIEARVRLFLDVLAAVGHAHANLIVHRDIKPSNIYVDRNGVVKLLDFGIAKLVESDIQPEAATRLTQDGARALTPEYAAPEQVIGGPITVATDIYSLGVLFYVLLSGEHPTGEKGHSAPQFIRSLLDTEPGRLSDSASQPQIKRTLRGDLDNIVAKALKKAPLERYASVKHFADDLKRYLNDEPVLARADNTWYRVRKFVARNRLPVAIGSTALLAVIASAAVALFEARTATAERDRALALSLRNEAVADFLNTVITESAGADKPVTIRDMLNRSETVARAQYRDTPEDRAAIFDMLGMYYMATDSYDRADSLLQEARSSVKSSTDADLLRKLACDHAMVLSSIGKAPDAIRVLDAAIAEPGITTQQAALCLNFRAEVAWQSNDAANALKFSTQALERLHQAAHPSPFLEANLLSTLGYAEHLNNRNDLADHYYTQSLAAFEKLGRGRGAEAISVRNNWALVSDAAGVPRRSFELYEESLKMVEQTDSGAPPQVAIIYNSARALESLGRFDEAVSRYTQCAAGSEKAGMPPGQVFCVLGLASVALEKGDVGTAERQLAAAAAIIGPKVPENFPPAPRMQTLRGAVAMARGRNAEARSALDGVINGSKSPLTSTFALRVRADLNLQENQLAAAETDARESLTLAEAARGGAPYSNRTGLVWLTMGNILARKGDTAEANKAYRAAVEHLSHTVDATHPKLLLAQQLAGR
ncbi:MAG: protein kinase [Proteobacteria bacterium]|nr:protein kinase [Pseudomonadota bacterium]